MNISDFGKTMESVRKHRETKLVTIEKISNYLLSGPNYQTPKLFSKNLITIELKKKNCSKNRLFRFINIRNKSNCNV